MLEEKGTQIMCLECHNRLLGKEGLHDYTTEKLRQLRIEIGGIYPNYLDENFRNLLSGSGLLGIDKNFNSMPTDKGKQFCKEHKW